MYTTHTCVLLIRPQGERIRSEKLFAARCIWQIEAASRSETQRIKHVPCMFVCKAPTRVCVSIRSTHIRDDLHHGTATFLLGADCYSSQEATLDCRAPTQRASRRIFRGMEERDFWREKKSNDGPSVF